MGVWEEHATRRPKSARVPIRVQLRESRSDAGTLVDHDESPPVGKTSVGSGPRGTARGVMSLEGTPPFLAGRASTGVLPVSLSYFGLLERLPDSSKPPVYHWLRNTPRHVLHLPIQATYQVPGWTGRLGSTPTCTRYRHLRVTQKGNTRGNTPWCPRTRRGSP